MRLISDLTRTLHEQLCLINWQILTRKEILKKKKAGQIWMQNFTIHGTLYLEISLREILLTNEMC